MVNVCIRLPAEQVFVSSCLQSRSQNHPEYGLVTLREYGLTIVLEYGLVTLREYGLVTHRENVPVFMFPPQASGCQLVHRPQPTFCVCPSLPS